VVKILQQKQLGSADGKAEVEKKSRHASVPDKAFMCCPNLFGFPYTLVSLIYTSSTAQGGGGSFKNRKPIGELGCCE
jgi:hypothetical protein